MNVEEDEIRRELLNPLERLHAVLGFADDLDVVAGPEQLPQPVARRLLVVHEKRANRRHDENVSCVRFTTITVTSSVAGPPRTCRRTASRTC